MTADPLHILDFWWRAGPARWFARDDAFDEACRDFHAAYEAAARGALDGWAAAPHSALALVLLTDQIPRNIFRGTARAFATDEKALATASTALEQGFDRAFPPDARAFFYLPFMHSEDIAAQERALDLYRALGEKEQYFYAFLHHDAIRRFGRFPHRNAVLGRPSTPAETAYLEGGGFAA